MFRTVCENCKGEIKVPDRFEGKKARCKHCEAVIRVEKGGAPKISGKQYSGGGSSPGTSSKSSSPGKPGSTFTPAGPSKNYTESLWSGLSTAFSATFPFAIIGTIALVLFVFILRTGKDSPDIEEGEVELPTGGGRDSPSDEGKEGEKQNGSKPEQRPLVKSLPAFPSDEISPGQYSKEQYQNVVRKISFQLVLDTDPSPLLFRVPAADRVPVLIKAIQKAWNRFQVPLEGYNLNCCRFPPKDQFIETPLPELEALSTLSMSREEGSPARRLIRRRIRNRLQKLSLSKFDPSIEDPATLPETYLRLQPSLERSFSTLISAGSGGTREGEMVFRLLPHRQNDGTLEGSMAAALTFLESTPSSLVQNNRNSFQPVRETMKYWRSNPPASLLPHPEVSEVFFSFPRSREDQRTIQSMFRKAIRQGQTEKQRLLAYVAGLPGWAEELREALSSFFENMLGDIHPDRMKNPGGVVRSVLLYAYLQGEKTLYKQVRKPELISLLSEDSSLLTAAARRFGDTPLLEFLKQKQEEQSGLSWEVVLHRPKTALKRARKRLRDEQVPNKDVTPVMWTYLLHAPRSQLPKLYQWSFEHASEEPIPELVALSLQPGKFQSEQIRKLLQHFSNELPDLSLESPDSEEPIFPVLQDHPQFPLLRNRIIWNDLNGSSSLQTTFFPDHSGNASVSLEGNERKILLYLMDGLLRCCRERVRTMLLEEEWIQETVNKHPKLLGSLLFRHGFFEIGLEYSRNISNESSRDLFLETLFSPELQYRSTLSEIIREESLPLDEIDVAEESKHWFEDAFLWSLWGNWLFNRQIRRFRTTPLHPFHMLLSRREANSVFRVPEENQPGGGSSSGSSEPGPLSAQLRTDRQVFHLIATELLAGDYGNVRFGSVGSPETRVLSSGSSYPGLPLEVGEQELNMYQGYQFGVRGENDNKEIQFRVDLIQIGGRWKAFRLRDFEVQETQ